MIPRQRDIDYLVQALWRARVWMNQQRRLRQAAPTPNSNDIPPLLRKQLERTRRPRP
jgi:hypothetical protein